MSDLTPAVASPQLNRSELTEKSREIRFALAGDQRGSALAVYESVKVASSPLVASELEKTFGGTMEAAAAGRRVCQHPSSIPDVARTYADLRDSERELLLSTATMELQRAAPETWDAIAAKAERQILMGMAQQLFFADLAVHLGMVPEPAPALRDTLMKELVTALTTALRVGAPGTRTNVMEGLGALLRHFDKKVGMVTLPSVDAKERATIGAPPVNQSYEQRHRRHEQIVLAIARETVNREAYFETLASAVAGDYDHRAEYIAALPAICRQADPATRAAMYETAVGILCTAAAHLRPPDDTSPEIKAKFTRYQETVFHTINMMLDRQEVDAKAFDHVVARAVDAIPGTLVGPLDLCNGYARATVSVLFTAAKIAAREKNAETDKALEPLYRRLQRGWEEWMNPGIIEGCVRGLPLLLHDNEHQRWTAKALRALLKRLVKPAELSDLPGTHMRLCATAAFRSLMIDIAEQLHKQQLARDTAQEQEQLEDQVEEALWDVLSGPTPEKIQAVFENPDGVAAIPARPVSHTYAAGVASAVAFSREALNRSPELFRGWEQMTPAQQLLLVRILGLQLQSASHGRRELARCEVLKKILDGLSAVRMDERTRTEKLWRLLSEIPWDACEAADPDLHEFVAYRSGRPEVVNAPRDKQNDDDLPGYVLSLVSDNVSYRLAADIARQVDLDRRRDELENKPSGFANQLYQVMLRGPNIAIFDHLLARIPEPRDRKLLDLLRMHISSVTEMKDDADTKVEIRNMVTHVEQTLLPAIEKYLSEYESDTVGQLRRAMKQFVVLAKQDPQVWGVIIGKPSDPALRELFEPHPQDKTEDGGLEVFFRLLDEMAGKEMEERKQIAALCEEDCLQLRLKIEQYLSLPVGDFQGCDRALRDAIRRAAAIRKKLNEAGLQPPERHILIGLLRSWEDMFQHTIAWGVDAPRRGVDAHRPQWFWNHIVLGLRQKADTAPGPEQEPEVSWPDGSMHVEERQYGKALQERRYGREFEADLPLPPEKTRPPVPPGQHAAFERYFVDWMAAQLDVDHLKWALGEGDGRRWTWFRYGYGLITHWLGVTLLIAIPCAIAASLHSRTGGHKYEGVGFFVYLVVLCVLTLVALVGSSVKAFVRHARRWWASWWGTSPPVETVRPDEYRFQALLPRLFRFIVVPVALVVDFDHSYLFPMHASNAVLVMLMLLAVLTTSFFIRRELHVRRTEYARMDKDDRGAVTGEWRRVAQIVSIALAHSFAVAILFSFIFESNIVARTKATDLAVAQALKDQRDAGKHTKAEHAAIEGEAALFHDEPYFLGFLPREAECDLVNVFHSLGFSERAAERMRFHFYPTLILTWTALGLFFGLFLDGFMKGERLREEVRH